MLLVTVDSAWGCTLELGECFFLGCDGEAGEEDEEDELVTATVFAAGFAVALADAAEEGVNGVPCVRSDTAGSKPETGG